MTCLVLTKLRDLPSLSALDTVASHCMNWDLLQDACVYHAQLLYASSGGMLSNTACQAPIEHHSELL